MKKIYSALVSLLLVLGLSTGAQAATFDINGGVSIVVPDSFDIGNATSTGEPSAISTSAGSVVDYWNFNVDSNASFASIAGTVGISGEGFTSFATALETWVDDAWSQIAVGATSGFGTIWSSLMSFSTLAPDPAAYRIKVEGTKLAGSAAYGGTMTVAAPIPEPEIYAMMAAGLGLMGFVARRRQRNGAVA